MKTQVTFPYKGYKITAEVKAYPAINEARNEARYDVEAATVEVLSATKEGARYPLGLLTTRKLEEIHAIARREAWDKEHDSVHEQNFPRT